MLARKPGALRNGAPFKDWALPGALSRVRARLTGHDDGDRQMVAILTAVLADGAFSADVVLNIRKRRRQPSETAPIPTPAGLRLRIEPVADCTRYDRLREPAMERHEVLEMMAALKLAGMCAAFDEQLADGLKRQYPAQRIIGELLKAKIAGGGVQAAISDALERGVIGFDSVKHLVLCRIERRPPLLTPLAYPYLPRAEAATTSASSCMGLLTHTAS